MDSQHFAFDIPDFTPVFFETKEQLLLRHGERLRSLCGQTIRAISVMDSDDDEDWWNEGPLVISLDGMQMELFAWEVGFSLTFDAIDLGRSPWRWVDDGATFEWRPATQAILVGAIGETIREVHVADSLMDSRWMFGEVDLSLDRDCLCVFNALDEIGVAHVWREGDWLKRVSVR